MWFCSGWHDLLHSHTGRALCWACGEEDRPCTLEWQEKKGRTLMQRIQTQPGDAECRGIPSKTHRRQQQRDVILEAETESPAGCQDQGTGEVERTKGTRERENLEG